MDALAEAAGDETVQDGVDYLRAIADEHEVSRDDQDEALLEMFARAKACYEERTGEAERRDERECDCDRQEQEGEPQKEETQPAPGSLAQKRTITKDPQ